MDRVQKKKRGWMKYVIAELIFLAVGGLFCLLFWRKETERTKENGEAYTMVTLTEKAQRWLIGQLSEQSGTEG